MTADRRFLSVLEVANTLGVSDDLIYSLIASGDLPAVEAGRRKMIPARVIDEIEAAALRDFDPDRLATSLATAADLSAEGSPPFLRPPKSRGRPGRPAESVPAPPG